MENTNSMATDTKSRIDTINAEIKQLEKKRKKLQDDCPHKQTKVVNYSWRPGCVDEVYMCTECNTIIKFLETIGVVGELTVSQPCGFFMGGSDTAGNCTVCGVIKSLHN